MKKIIIFSLVILGLISCENKNESMRKTEEIDSNVNVYRIPKYERLVEIRFNSSNQPIIITENKYRHGSYYIYLPYNDGTFKKGYKIIDNIK